ncbi:winged helix-turn-helix domain-containing protein [Salinicola avicenniae]|uniref:winged helix-turn-helix domain-containing protein n=1 Tax=Salinicola avicenniae TaxID=2916836 RepID=UPI00207421FE|nr:MULTISPECIES: crosslink repair DNA glycosylase YcaQ family protein [unclassified Salinicola]
MFSRDSLARAQRELTPAQARHLALKAQGFTATLPQRPNRGHLKRLLNQLGVLQIDSVNAVVRSHYLPLFARLGDYPTALLDEAAWGRNRHRQLFEYWGHEASLLPLSRYPALVWRMQQARRGIGIYKGLARFGRERQDVIERVLANVQSHGPVSAGALNTRDTPAGQWWDWSDEKHALEWLFAAGKVTVAARRGFERLYDLPERVLPASVLQQPVPTPLEAHRQLLYQAAEALGVATEKDLRDYYRLTPKATREALATLLEEASLTPVSVAGWRQTAYLVGDPVIPRRLDASALLSPFDSLIWYRERTERLFGFHYRLEFYVPPHRRVFGYYVMPFLHRGRLIARVDLRTRRETRELAILALHPEPGVDFDADALETLADRLESLARWLGLAQLHLACERDLARRLTSHWPVDSQRRLALT